MSTVTYLSRIWLNPLRVGAQRLLRNPQAMHAAVLGGMPNQPVVGRTLWRLELGNPHRAELLALTKERPSWEHLVEQAGWPGAEHPQAEVRSYEPLLSRLIRGQEYTFRLRANPISSTRNPAAPSSAQKEHLSTSDRPRGVLVPHRTVAHQLAWLTQRIDVWGLSPQTTVAGDPQVHVSARDRVTFTKRAASGTRHRVTLQTATYEGRVQVIDPKAVKAALTQGVGRARAYGCGLLTLAPAPRT